MSTPNSILFMRAFGAVCWGWGFRPYVNLFRSLFRILRSKNGFLAAIWICPFLPATRTPSAIGSRVLLSFIWGGNRAGVLTMLGEILTLSVVFSPICLSGRSYISHVWLLSLISTTCSSVYNFLLGAIVMLLVNLDQFSLLMLFSLFYWTLCLFCSFHLPYEQNHNAHEFFSITKLHQAGLWAIYYSKNGAYAWAIGSRALRCRGAVSSFGKPSRVCSYWQFLATFRGGEWESGLLALVDEGLHCAMANDPWLAVVETGQK